jgi:hypothetical protein
MHLHSGLELSSTQSRFHILVRDATTATKQLTSGYLYQDDGGLDRIGRILAKRGENGFAGV